LEFLGEVTVAPVTTTIRDILSEVLLTKADGMPPGDIFQTSADFSMNLQTTYDLRSAKKALPARVTKSIEENRSVLV
jgi:plasmid maintenance system antidote protein VapI